MNIFLSIPANLSASPMSTLGPKLNELSAASYNPVWLIISSLFLLVMPLLFVGFFVLWIWCLINLLSSSVKTSTDKLLWFIVITFLPFIGTILYLFIGKDKFKKSRVNK